MNDDQVPTRHEKQAHPISELPEHAGGSVGSKATSCTPSQNPGDDALPGTPGTGEDICQRCAGSGKITGGQECPDCDGTGTVIQGIGGG